MKINQYFVCSVLLLLSLLNSPVISAQSAEQATQEDELLGFFFLSEPKDALVGDQNVRFECSFLLNRSDATAEVEWRRDGNSLVSDSSPRLLISGNSLVINESQPIDEGVYQCVISVRYNGFSWVFASRRAHLIVPKFLGFAQQPISQKVFVNSSVAFRCAAETNTRLLNLSKNPLTIQWFHNNHPITDGADGVNILPVSHTLEILHAQKHHSGVYNCVARSGAQSITSQLASLDVLEGFTPNGAISFVLQPRPQSVKEGGDVLVECLVNANPKAKITWLKDGRPLEVSDSKYQRVGILRSSLLIPDASAEDGGLFVCRADNGEDNTEASAVISVHTPPVLTKRPTDVITQETADVEFECAASGHPPPRIIWLKNGEVITLSEYFVISDDRLKIYGLIRDDQGVYQCSVNSGETGAFAQLIVHPAPLTQALIADGQSPQRIIPAPLGLQAQSIGSKSLRLKWNPPIGLEENGEITYKVIHREDVGGSTEMTATSPTSSITITALKADTPYILRVEAVKGTQSGLPSGDIRVRTKPNEVAILKVQNLKATVTSSDSAQIDWESPAASDVHSLRFKLFYRRVDGSTEGEEIQAVVAKTTYTLHSLKKNAEYAIRVQVVAPGGLGETSDVVRFRTFADVPGTPPLNVRADSPAPGTLRIRWEPPTTEEQNGQLTSYKIRYKQKAKGARSYVVTADSTALEHQVSGLETGVHYQFRMAAQNQNGTGPFSEWITAEVLADEQTNEVAPAPSELRVFAEHDSVHVSWLPPREHGIIIRGYSIGWGVYVPDREKTSVGPDEREYKISGLKPNREYVISVRAITRAGDGFPIYETVKTSAYSRGLQATNSKETDGMLKTPDVPLTAVVGVQAESVSSSAIRLSWTDPNNAFNPLYSVRYSHSGGSEYHYVNTSETEILVDGLQPNTQYEFAVRLFESTSWSMSALSRTQPAAPSSAPRDLTILPSSPVEREDPTAVTLNWQPPKYANGEVEEYIVLYSDRLDLPDRDWIVDSVKGDRLSMKVFSLVPNTAYYFKVQARNVKGYGPLSPVVTYTPDRLAFVPSGNERTKLVDGERKPAAFVETLTAFVRNNAIYVVGGSCLIILILVIVLIVACCRKGGNSKQVQRHQYIAGRKLASPGRDSGGRNGGQPDCWIAHPSNRVELVSGVPATHELKQFATHAESPPPRYQTLQGNNSSISRNYNSTVSLEGRQRTPQIMFTGTNRQHINKVDLSSDRGSSFGGSNTILQLGHTPPLPNGEIIEAGYQTVRHANPLRSFVHMNVPPPPETADSRSPLFSQPSFQAETRFARPMVIASPLNNRASTSRPAGVVTGQRSTTSGIAPIGLAQAQPRVNITSVYSPYQSTLGSREDLRKESSGELNSKLKDERPLSQTSAEEFNAGQLDSIIDTLRGLRQEFEG